jgi:hypothetical protein
MCFLQMLPVPCGNLCPMVSSTLSHLIANLPEGFQYWQAPYDILAIQYQPKNLRILRKLFGFLNSSQLEPLVILDLF